MCWCSGHGTVLGLRRPRLSLGVRPVVPVLTGDKVDAMRLLMNFPPVKSIHAIVDYALHIRQPEQYPAPQVKLNYLATQTTEFEREAQTLSATPQASMFRGTK